MRSARPAIACACPVLGADLLRELTRALHAPDAHLFMKHKSQPVYHRIAGLSTTEISQTPVFQADSPLMHELALYRHAMYVDRLMELPRLRALWIGEWESLRLLQGEVLVPVLVSDDLMGFLILGARPGGEPYTRQELQQTLPLIANQISIAMANSRLYEQEQRRADELAQSNADLTQAQAALSESADRIRREAARAEALVRIANRLNEQLDLATVLTAVCEETARALSAPAAGVALYVEKTDTLDFVAGHGLPKTFLAQQISMPYAAYARSAGINGTIILDGKTSVFPELIDPPLRDEFAQGACVMTSMLRGGGVVGCLMARAFDQPRQFSEDEMRTLLLPTLLYHEQPAALKAAGIRPKAMAHITGGGLPENLGRMFLKRGLGANLRIPFWQNDVVQKVLRHADKKDAIDTFNMGLGWVAIVSSADAEKALTCGKGAKIIGEMDTSAQVSVEIV